MIGVTARWLVKAGAGLFVSISGLEAQLAHVISACKPITVTVG